MIEQKHTSHPQPAGDSFPLATLVAIGGALAQLAGGCSPERPNPTVARMHLQANSSGALMVDGCGDKTSGACAGLPNPQGCEQLDVEVLRGGEVRGVCRRTDGSRSLLDNPLEGVPVVCSALTARGLDRVRCVSLFGDPMLDTGCAEGETCDVLEPGQALETVANRKPLAAPKPGAIWDYDPDDVGTESCGEGSDDDCTEQATVGPASSDEGDTLVAPTAPAIAPDPCAPDQARRLYADKLNGVLAGVGLVGSYEMVADPESFYSQLGSSSLSHVSATAWATQQCADASRVGTSPGGIVANDDRRPFCELSRWDLSRYDQAFAYSRRYASATCRCGGLAAAIRNEVACELVALDCDARRWGPALVVEYSAANKWLNSQKTLAVAPDAGGNPSDASDPEIPAPDKGLDTADDGQQFGGSIDIQDQPGTEQLVQATFRCSGSPLVLDLDGDGLQLSAVDDGVTFDLVGSGPLQTAWTRGDDDAFLALDRNGDGTIDHGRELFGEADNLAGFNSRDGFEALSLLDEQTRGGDGNGLLDRRDFLYDQLVLWTDRDRNGVSDPSELQTLAQAGVQALSLERSKHDQLDSHGNDLGLRGHFLRPDGTRGALVDVFFVTRLR